jgi:hypothetical protein
MQLHPPGFAPALWHRLRHPSTLVMLGAGLLAADRLRWLPPAWAGATSLVLALLVVLLGFALLRRLRQARDREVQLLVLPPSLRRPGA